MTVVKEIHYSYKGNRGGSGRIRVMEGEIPEPKGLHHEKTM